MALGTAELQTNLLDQSFRQVLKRLEADTLKSFTRMGAASDGIIDNRASANVKQLESALKPLQAALRTTASEGAKVGDGLSTGAVKAKRELTPLEKSISVWRARSRALATVLGLTLNAEWLH